MSRLSVIQKQADVIKSLAASFGAGNVRIFGSTSHQRDRQTSDLDLLIDWNSPHSLFDQVALQQSLEDLLNIKVDLVTAKNLHWYVKDRILEEAIPL